MREAPELELAEALRAPPLRSMRPAAVRPERVFLALGADPRGWWFKTRPDEFAGCWYDVQPSGSVGVHARIRSGNGWAVGIGGIVHLRITDPRAAWEALLAEGVLPGQWAGDGARRFASTAPCPRCRPTRRRSGCPACVGRGTVPGDASPLPPTLAAVVDFAMGVEAVERSEELARELAARLAPWGAPPLGGVVWWSGPACAWGPTGWPRDARRAPGPLGAARRALAAAAPEGDPRRALAEEEGGRIRDVFGVRRSARWAHARADARLFGASDGPLAPLLDLWGEGHGLDALDERGAVLFRPLPGSWCGSAVTGAPETPG